MTTATTKPALTERQKQRTAAKLVEREVIHCASSLISYLAKQDDPELIDDLLTISVQDDWTTPAEYHARTEGSIHDAYLIAEHDDTDADDTEALENALTALDLIDGDESINPREAMTEVMRKTMARVLESDDNQAREYCETNRLDPEQHEAYEHWIVTDWLARKLEERGEMVAEILDLQIWGRLHLSRWNCGPKESTTSTPHPPANRSRWTIPAAYPIDRTNTHRSADHDHTETGPHQAHAMHGMRQAPMVRRHHHMPDRRPGNPTGSRRDNQYAVFRPRPADLHRQGRRRETI